MSVPVRYIGLGDPQLSRGMLSKGKKELNALLRDMEFNDGQEAGKSFVQYEDGTSVLCVSIAGVSRVYLDATALSNKQKREKYVCPCFPHFSLGVIQKVTPEEPTDAQMRESRFTYDVEVCNTNYYLFYEDMYDANYGKYFVGQFVLVSIGAEMDEWEVPLDCDRDCLADTLRFDVLMVVPVHIAEKMVMWEVEDEL